MTELRMRVIQLRNENPGMTTEEAYRKTRITMNVENAKRLNALRRGGRPQSTSAESAIESGAEAPSPGLSEDIQQLMAARGSLERSRKRS